MIRRPPRSTQSRSSAASDVYKRQNGQLSWSDPILSTTLSDRASGCRPSYSSHSCRRQSGLLRLLGGCELGRSEVAEQAVQMLGVVLLSPALEHDAGVLDAPE